MFCLALGKLLVFIEVIKLFNSLLRDKCNQILMKLLNLSNRKVTKLLSCYKKTILFLFSKQLIVILQ